MAEATAHQLLHGYRGGHGQIAASTKLLERDAELVSRLSDLSGSLSSGLQIPTYLTLYPLPSKKHFAVARTWGDPDAPRSGCVLTHTILVPMPFWGEMTDLRRLDRMFQNPRTNPDHDFSEPVFLSNTTSEHPSHRLEIGVDTAQSFVSRYFGDGLRPIVWFDAAEPDEYLWRIAEHLWPKLRRAFSSCTFSLQLRRLEDRPFDLLFAPSEVYSRFAKLSSEHLLEAGLSARSSQNNAEPEPWSQYWVQALFSSHAGLPSHEDQLPIWNELGEDPTAARKLSLVRELRSRAEESPTAGVGAIDVVESLAYDPELAIPLKRQVLSDAISSAARAEAAGEALVSLRLIDDRLRRQSLRDVASEFEKPLALAVEKITLRNPEAAIEASGTWLADTAFGANGPFAQGVMLGLRELAKNSSPRLTVLQSHPDVAAELFRQEPTFAAMYVELGDQRAIRDIADWLAATCDKEKVRFVRNSLLPLASRIGNEELLEALLKDTGEDDVRDALSSLYQTSEHFSNSMVRNVISKHISPSYPQLVRQWSSSTTEWSDGLSQIVASTYPFSRSGFTELLDDKTIASENLAFVVTAILSNRAQGNYPYWLRDLVSSDVRIVRSLLLAGVSGKESIEGALSKLLSETPELPLAESAELAGLVFRYEGRAVFPQLFDSTMRAAILAIAAKPGGPEDLKVLLESERATKWFETVSGSQLASLLVRSGSLGTGPAARVWDWLSKAPKAIYVRRPSIFPDLCDSLMVSVRKSFPEGVQESFIRVVRRSGVESGAQVRQVLCGKMLRFALDNARFPLGGVVAEVFADVYAIAIKKQNRRPSFFSRLFSSYDWDQGKDLRVALVDAFTRTSWAPGDLAIAASNAGILPKIFKRLQRVSNGDKYARAMLQDLDKRSDPQSASVKDQLRMLLANPDFFEEWD